MAADLDLSVIIPCYREEPHLAASVQTLSAVLDRTRCAYELIFVDDRSPDGTRDVIEEVCRGRENARYIFHERNMGRGGAFKTGFKEARGRIAGFVDIDLEVGAHYIPPLVRLIEDGDCDVATGNRHYLLSQTEGWVRHVLSQGYRMLCGFFLNFGVKDSETGCKFFRRDACREAVLGSASDGWFWDTEVMARAALANLRITEMPVLFLRRFDKASTVRIVRDSFDYMVELYRFRRRVGLGLIDRSPIYWTRVGYDAFMSLLCGAELRRTLARVAALIPEGSSVTDVCCGTARLYRDHLHNRSGGYLGLDANGHFIMSLKRRAVPCKLHNALTDPIDPADYVVMSNSFYHFHDRRDELIARMKGAARKGVILTEPVQNASAHPFAPLAAFAKWLTNPGVGDHTKRFDLEGFRAFTEEHGGGFVYEEGDRNALAVFTAE